MTRKPKIEFEEVTAEIIEPEQEEATLAVSLQPAVIVADFDKMKAVLEKKLEDYDGMTAESLYGCEEKELKPLRTELNSWINEIEDARKSVKRQYNGPLEEFEARCKELVKMIEGPKGQIDSVIKRKEAEGRSYRLSLLEDAYAEFCECNGCSALVQNIPLERIIENQWLNKSFGEAKAKNCLEDRVAAILSDWNAVKSMVWYFPKDAEICFFETLSIRKVSENDQKLNEQHRKLEELKQEVGDVQQERRVDQAAQDTRSAEVINAKSDVFVLALQMNEVQKNRLIGLLKQAGLSGKIRRTHYRSVQEVMEVFNAR